jgi:hypothetical protein
MSVPEYTKKSWRDWYNRNKDNDDFKNKVAKKNAINYQKRKQKKKEESKITVIKLEGNEPNIDINNDVILEDKPNIGVVPEDKPNIGVVPEDKPNNDVILEDKPNIGVVPEDKPNIELNNSIFMDDVRNCINDLETKYINNNVCFSCANEGAIIDCSCYGKYKHKKTIKNNNSINNILTKKQSKKPKFFTIEDIRKFQKDNEENIREYNAKKRLRVKNNV